MSCFQCCKSFGLLNKELSCEKCRLSFCSKCLCHKIQISSVSNDFIKVCKRCYTSETSIENIDIPKNLQKLKEKNTSTKTKTSISDLENRVNNLRSTNVPIPKTEDIEKRLQNLRGMPINNPISNKNNPSLFYVKPKSEQDQISQLLIESQDEFNLNTRIQETNKCRNEDIEKKLLKLKDSSVSQNFIKQNNDYLNPDKVLEQIFDEINIEEKYQPNFQNVSSTVQVEELPYCCLCTKDAVWQCHDCDEDLYCNSCYKKCHKKDEYGPHKHTEYKSMRP